MYNTRVLKIDAVSWKTRKILSKGMWVSLSHSIPLEDLKIGETYTFKVSQLMNGKWVLDEIIGGDND